MLALKCLWQGRGLVGGAPLVGWGGHGPEVGGSCLKLSGLCVAEPRTVTAASLTSVLSRAHLRQKPHLRKAPANRGPRHPAAGVAAAVQVGRQGPAAQAQGLCLRAAGRLTST